MPNNDPERLTRSSADEARQWASSPEGRAELARLESAGDEGIDFSDIPEMGEPRLVERVTDALRKAEDDEVLAVMANAANLLRERHIAGRKAG